MAVTWVGGAGNYTTVSGTLGVTLPAFVAGDLAVVIVSNDAGTDPNYVGPSGWTFGGKTAATNMYSYIWYRVLQAGDTTVGITAGAGGTISVGIWRNAAWVTLGTFGIRGASSYTVTAPSVASASGIRLHLFGDRTVASSAGEVDKLHTLTYGTPRYFHAGNPTLAAAVGISAAYFSDSLTGSGDNTATFADNATNAWGVQVAINDTTPAANPKTETLTDDFATNNTTKWPNVNRYGTVAIQNGRVESTERVASYSGILSPQTYTLMDSYVSVKLTPPTVQAPSTESALVVRDPTAANIITWIVTGGWSVMRLKVAGVSNETGMTYNPTTMAWLRVRQGSGNYYWDSSPDGVTWTTQRTLASPLVLDTVGIELSVGQWQAEATQSTGYFDNINVAGVAQTGGRPKAYVAGSFQKKPGKWWNGTAWIEKPWKQWTGTQWKTLT